MAYIIFALLPVYWMINMSFKTNTEILASFSLLPENFTWANYQTILTDPSGTAFNFNQKASAAAGVRCLSLAVEAKCIY